MNIKTLYIVWFSLIGGLTGACAPAATQVPSATPATFDGLVEVRARGLDHAYLRPNVMFDKYTGIMLDAPELAFRTPDTANKEVILTQEQQAEFRRVLQRAFEEELTQLKTLSIAEATGEGVLRLRVRVQDIRARVTPNAISSGGWSSLLLESIGQATLLLELYDSRSNEILARVIDDRSVQGVGMRREGGSMQTKWDGIDDLSEHWATLARRRLDVVSGGVR